MQRVVVRWVPASLRDSSPGTERKVAMFDTPRSRRAFLRHGLTLAVATAALSATATACSMVSGGKQSVEITHADTFVADDAKFWEPFAAQFKEQTGISVKHQ